MLALALSVPALAQPPQAEVTITVPGKSKPAPTPAPPVQSKVAGYRASTPVHRKPRVRRVVHAPKTESPVVHPSRPEPRVVRAPKPERPERKPARVAKRAESAVDRGESASALNSKGYRLIKQGRFADAEPLLRAAVKRDPGFAYGQYNLGCALLGQGKAREALAPLQRAAKLEPERWEVSQKLGEAFRRLGNEERANSAFDHARSLRGGRRYSKRASSEVQSKLCETAWSGSTDLREDRYLTSWREYRASEAAHQPGPR